MWVVQSVTLLTLAYLAKKMVNFNFSYNKLYWNKLLIGLTCISQFLIGQFLLVLFSYYVYYNFLENKHLSRILVKMP